MKLPTLIIISMILGIVFAVLFGSNIGIISKIKEKSDIDNAINTFGDIFIRLISMVIVPLVVASLIYGMASLGDIKKLGRVATKTFIYYIVTTMLAIIIGLVLVNLIKPGEFLTKENKELLKGQFETEAKKKQESVKERTVNFWEFLKSLFPENPIKAMTEGKGAMLQIIFFAIFFGLTVTLLSKELQKPIVELTKAVMEVMVKMVGIIMWVAPIGVFCLITSIVGKVGLEVLFALLIYCIVVVLGLAIHIFGSYSILLKVFSKLNPITFFKAMRPAQVTAFGTSSSAAALPVNMACVRKLGVSDEITSFVLPLGATVNMDGTALYQAVAVVFIGQVMGLNLSIIDQITILIMVTLASIGAAPTPGAGIIMLLMVLDSVGIPKEGIAFILGVDRILDMCRTVVNVTGDAVGSVIVATSEKEKIGSG